MMVNNKEDYKKILTWLDDNKINEIEEILKNKKDSCEFYLELNELIYFYGIGVLFKYDLRDIPYDDKIDLIISRLNNYTVLSSVISKYIYSLDNEIESINLIIKDIYKTHFKNIKKEIGIDGN